MSRETDLLRGVGVLEREGHAPRDVASLSLHPSQAAREASTSELSKRSFLHPVSLRLLLGVGRVDAVVAL